MMSVDELLKKAENIIALQEKETNQNGGRFNIFSILNLESDEVRLHSAFLASLLDPSGTHGRKEKPLKLFLEIINSALKFDYESAKVYCEFFVGELGRIDIVITDRNNLVVIENKIYASEQENQLKRYDEYAKKSGKKYEIYYLTLEGKESENESFTNYKKISYGKEILYWLETLELPQNVKTVVLQYCSTMRTLTDKNEKGIEMEMEKLLINKEALQSADVIARAVPAVKAKIEMEFWRELYKMMEAPMKELGFEMFADHLWTFDEEDIEYIIEERKKSGGLVELYFRRKLNNGENLDFVIGQFKNNPIAINVSFVNTDNKNIKNEKLTEIARQIGLDRISREWLWQYHSQGITLQGDDFYKLLDDIEKRDIAQSIAEEAIGYAKRLSMFL